MLGMIGFNPTEQLAEDIAARLFHDGATNLSDDELLRVLPWCSGGSGLVEAAKQLRDAGMLTLAAEWIAKRHRHGNEVGAVCACDTPDVNPLREGSPVSVCFSCLTAMSVDYLELVRYDDRYVPLCGACAA